MKSLKNCNVCKHVDITEEEQVDKTVGHKCLKYKVKLSHRSDYADRIYHGYIYPCIQCKDEDFEHR